MIYELQKTVYAINEAKGWHDESLCDTRGTYTPDTGQLTLPTGLKHTAILAKLALVHTEIGEAADEAEQGRFDTWYNGSLKPEGFSIEIADAVIRVADTCEALGLNAAGLAVGTKRPYMLAHLRRTIDHACEALRVDDPLVFAGACAAFIECSAGLCTHYSLELGTALQLKIAYNRTRPFKHGGKLA